MERDIWITTDTKYETKKLVYLRKVKPVFTRARELIKYQSQKVINLGIRIEQGI